MIPTLIDLLDHENIQVKTFTNGVLYSLMPRKKLREDARRLNLKGILERQMLEEEDER